MNPYYYLFYRLSRFYNRKGNNPIGPIGAISVLIGLNALVVYSWILPIMQERAQGINTKGYMALALAIIIANSFLFLNKRRVGEIMIRYSDESVRSRRIGGFLVIVYVVLTVGLVLCGAKPLN